MTAFILVPKNSGLKKYRDIAISCLDKLETAKIIESRGEDIPFLMKQFAEKGKNAIGLTGEDLYKEYMQKQQNSSVRILKKIEWNDKKALFRKPALCLLGPKKGNPEKLPKKITVCISAKYKSIADQYLNELENKGYKINRIYINGCVETSCAEGIADLIVDIVYTGSSMDKYSLKIFDKIMESDFLILGTKKAVLARKITENVPRYNPPLENRRSKMRLDFNENTLGCSAKVIEVLKNVTAEEISAYPEYGQFKKTLAEFLGFNKEQIILTNGADEAIKLVIDTYVEENDEIIILYPTFSLFNVYASLSSGKITEIPYEKDLSFPIESLLESINDKTKLIMIANPNNPTGTSANEKEIKKILSRAKNAIVLLDEAYAQFSGKSYKKLVNEYENLVIIQTFSKAYGLAGLRFGYIIANEGIVSNMQKMCSPYSVNSLAVKAAEAAIQDPEFIRRYVNEITENKKYVSAELERLGIKVFPSDANFLLADFGNESQEIYEKLKENNILVRSMKKYPELENCLRITVGSIEQCKKFAEKVKEILREQVILFDLDGVLVDVSNSYRTAIIKTAEYFTKEQIKPEDIQALKEKGGYNNDWDITEKLIIDKGKNIPKDKIIQKFQEFYFEKEKFIDNEKWLIPENLLRELYQKYRLGIVTGRPKKEAMYVLSRNNVKEFFDYIVTLEDCPIGMGKPNPYGINIALDNIGRKNAVYFGDTVDDITAAVNAKIKAVGVLPKNVKSENLKELMLKKGASAIIEDIEKLKEVLQ